MNLQDPTVRIRNRGVPGTRIRVCAAAGLGSCRVSPPTSPCSMRSVSLASLHWAGPGQAEREELISSRRVCVHLHPKTSNHRLPLDSWQQRENKTAAAFIAENTKLPLLPNKPRRRSLISAPNSRPRSLGWAVTSPDSAMRWPVEGSHLLGGGTPSTRSLCY